MYNYSKQNKIEFPSIHAALFHIYACNDIKNIF